MFVIRVLEKKVDGTESVNAEIRRDTKGKARQSWETLRDVYTHNASFRIEVLRFSIVDFAGSPESDDETEETPEAAPEAAPEAPKDARTPLAEVSTDAEVLAALVGIAPQAVSTTALAAKLGSERESVIAAIVRLNAIGKVVKHGDRKNTKWSAK